MRRWRWWWFVPDRLYIGLSIYVDCFKIDVHFESLFPGPCPEILHEQDNDSSALVIEPNPYLVANAVSVVELEAIPNLGGNIGHAKVPCIATVTASALPLLCSKMTHLPASMVATVKAVRSA